MTEELLTWGADPNIQNNDGATCLHTAIDLGSKGCWFVDLLLKFSVNPLIADSEMKTSLHLTKCNHCAKGIIEASNTNFLNVHKHVLNV